MAAARIKNENDFRERCNWCIRKDARLQPIIEKYSFPPFWRREPNFATLVLTILEQQVSLASAKSAFNKLAERIGVVTPENLLKLSDYELRACYFSRQKTEYVKILVLEIVTGKLNLDELNSLSEKEIRDRMIQIKGIGNWTIDMYLMMSLHFSDIFPPGDLATIKAVYELELVPSESSKEEIVLFMEKFSPNRSVATYLLWHNYIQKRNKVLE